MVVNVVNITSTMALPLRDEIHYMLAEHSFSSSRALYAYKDKIMVVNESNIVLQTKKYIEVIFNITSFVNLTKKKLQKRLTYDNWGTLLNLVISFSGRNGIEVPNVEYVYVPQEKNMNNYTLRTYIIFKSKFLCCGNQQL